MNFYEYYRLEIGDIVTPIGNSKDKGRLFKVVDAGERYINCWGHPQRDNGIWVEPIDGKPITVTCPMKEGLYHEDEKRRRYQYQAIKKVEQV